METRKTIRFRVYGIVQGVGFRPTVSRHAAVTGISGSVCNKGPYVEIFAQGTGEQLESFRRLLKEAPPRRSAILKIEEKNLEEAEAFSGFRIIESEKTSGEIFISPDIAICEDCERELYDPENRRYLHPFINCTSCGPRMTILEGLPYDRLRTSMKMFPMCPACREEYFSPGSRRYDAQPVCCPDCGPQVYLAGRKERGREAILAARKCLAGGGILAVKGIGGFHLCCDAGNRKAVQDLRSRKHRLHKPFAVMAKSMEVVRRECLVEEGQEEILTGYQKPILLLPKREEGLICEEVAPGNPKLGMMLPYAPLQHLLFSYNDGLETPDVLVMTSGNDSGVPICRDDAEALEDLAPLCDLILSHDREIRIRADDSVMDWFRGVPYMIRRSRGYAPLPVPCGEAASGSVLALGGELKNTFCVARGGLFYLSPYIGDLEDFRAVSVLQETAGRFAEMLECKPAAVACDLHPGYSSTRLAEEMDLPVVRVQHHYAHILSCMAENGCGSRVIGLSFDGTGYGTDGTIWGGEALLCDPEGFERAGHIAPFLHVGGDAASREGWRIAVSMILGTVCHEEETAEIAGERLLKLCSREQALTICRMAKAGLNTVVSTSAGRLFDAVSAVLGICNKSSYEGEAAIRLQFAAQAWEKEQMQAGRTSAEIRRQVRECFPEVPLCRYKDGKARIGRVQPENGSGIVMATDELFRAILEQKLQGADGGFLAFAFHRILADQAAECCRLLREGTGLETAALSGGVFQNTLLLELVLENLEDMGFQVLTHHLVPPNDGGIALGQAVAAMAAAGKATEQKTAD